MSQLVEHAAGQDQACSSPMPHSDGDNTPVPSQEQVSAASASPVLKRGAWAGGTAADSPSSPFSNLGEDVLHALPGHRLVGRINEGRTFGELALRSRSQHRTATVRALSACLLLSISRDDFNIFRPLQDLLDISSDRLNMFLRLPFLRRLTKTQATEFMLGMRPVEVSPGATILAEGAPASGIVLLQTGEAEIWAPKHAHHAHGNAARRAEALRPPSASRHKRRLRKLCDVSSGHTIGALPFLLERPSLLEYRARTTCIVWEMGASQFAMVAARVKEDVFKHAIEACGVTTRLVEHLEEQRKAAMEGSEHQGADETHFGDDLAGVDHQGLDDAIGIGAGLGSWLGAGHRASVQRGIGRPPGTTRRKIQPMHAGGGNGSISLWEEMAMPSRPGEPAPVSSAGRGGASGGSEQGSSIPHLRQLQEWRSTAPTRYWGKTKANK